MPCIADAAQLRGQWHGFAQAGLPGQLTAKEAGLQSTSWRGAPKLSPAATRSSTPRMMRAGPSLS